VHISDHSIARVTDIEVTEVNLPDLLGAFDRPPNCPLPSFGLRRGTRRWWSNIRRALGGAMRPNAWRISFWSLGPGLLWSGWAARRGFVWLLTQYLLADALGLSSVYVNRVLRRLREKGLLTFRDGLVTFDNYGKLNEFADFDPTYLDQVGQILA